MKIACCPGIFNQEFDDDEGNRRKDQGNQEHAVVPEELYQAAPNNRRDQEKRPRQCFGHTDVGRTVFF